MGRSTRRSPPSRWRRWPNSSCRTRSSTCGGACALGHPIGASGARIVARCSGPCGSGKAAASPRCASAAARRRRSPSRCSDGPVAAGAGRTGRLRGGGGGAQRHPGVDFLLTVTRTLQGARAGLATAAGIGAGCPSMHRWPRPSAWRRCWRLPLGLRRAAVGGRRLPGLAGAGPAAPGLAARRRAGGRSGAPMIRAGPTSAPASSQRAQPKVAFFFLAFLPRFVPAARRRRRSFLARWAAGSSTRASVFPGAAGAGSDMARLAAARGRRPAACSSRWSPAAAEGKAGARIDAAFRQRCGGAGPRARHRAPSSRASAAEALRHRHRAPRERAPARWHAPLDVVDLRGASVLVGFDDGERFGLVFVNAGRLPARQEDGRGAHAGRVRHRQGAPTCSGPMRAGAGAARAGARRCFRVPEHGHPQPARATPGATALLRASKPRSISVMRGAATGAGRLRPAVSLHPGWVRTDMAGRRRRWAWERGLDARTRAPDVGRTMAAS